MIHYWWGGPNDGGEVDLASCSMGFRVPVLPPIVKYWQASDPVDELKVEQWECKIFREGTKIKHYLVPPGFVPPPSYTKIKDELQGWDLYINKDNNSGLI